MHQLYLLKRRLSDIVFTVYLYIKEFFCKSISVFTEDESNITDAPVIPIEKTFNRYLFYSIFCTFK